MVEEKVLKYCIENRLIKKKERIVVGVSGGADSVCLLFILRRLRSILDFDIVVVHVEHGLRGYDSLADAQFVKNICQVYAFPFRQYSYDVEELARTWKCSVEEAGRLVRYQSFALAQTEFNAGKVAVAHHENDQAETILWNLVRGTGLKGLAGMSPIRDHVIRPLLCLSRQEIEDYLGQCNLSYREDQTNHQNNYTRNKMRNVILPLITREMNERAVSHIAEAGRFVREADQFIAKAANQLYGQAVSHDEQSIRLDVAKLQAADHILQQYLVRLCIQELSESLRDITAVHVEQVIRFGEQQVGKQICLPGGLRIYREYGMLLFKHADDDKAEADVEINITPPQSIQIQGKKIDFQIAPYKMEIIPQKKCTMWLDYDKIRISLKIRNRRPGDYLVINNEGGKKKLKNFFIDEKIPRGERERVLLLAAGDQILWVIGYRKSADFRVTGDTKNVLKIQVDGG